MPVRLREIPWASQPQEFAVIDWTHPAARGLVGAWVPTQGPGNLAIPGGSSLFVPTSVEASGANLAGRFSGQISNDSAVTNAPALGFAIGFKTGTAATQSAVFSRGAGAVQFGFHASHSNSSYAGAVYSGAGYTIIGKPTGAALANNTRYDIGARIAASNGAVYSGGVKTATNASAAAPATSSAGLYFASQADGSNTWSVAPSIEYLYIWNIAPEDWVFKEVAANPWLIFEPQKIWVPVSVGAGTSIIPDTGTLAFSGFAPTVQQTANTSVSPAAGNLTFTGFVPSVTQAVSVVPDAGSFAFTGFAPTVEQTANVSLTPAAGALTFTGYAPTVTQTGPISVTPDPGNITFTGYAPTVTQTGAPVYIPPSASTAYGGGGGQEFRKLVKKIEADITARVQGTPSAPTPALPKTAVKSSSKVAAKEAPPAESELLQKIRQLEKELHFLAHEVEALKAAKQASDENGEEAAIMSILLN